MRKSTRPLDALFPRTRQLILAATMIHSERWWYQSDLARHIGTAPSSLQRELASLTAAQLLRSKRDGNRLYFQANTESPIFPELRQIFEKTVGVVEVLRRTVFEQNENRVETAFVYGSTAQGDSDASSDVDLFVIGRVTYQELVPTLRLAEGRLGREVNATVYPLGEFAGKVAAGAHFIKAVLDGPKLFVVGSQSDLDAATAGRHREAAHGDAVGSD